MKSIDFVNKKVSSKTGVDESIVKKVTMHYWKDVIKEMHAMKNPGIFLSGLGTFYIGPGNIRKIINNLLTKIKSFKSYRPDYKETESWSDYQIKFDRYWRIKKELDEVYEEKKRKRQNRERDKERGQDS